MAAACTVAIPEIGLCTHGQVFVDFEFSLAGEQIIAEGVDVEFVIAVCRRRLKLSRASNRRQVLWGHAAEIKVAAELRNLRIVQTTDVVVDGVVVQKTGAQKDIGVRAGFNGQINVLTVSAARTLEFIRGGFGVRHKSFGTAGAKLTCVQTNKGTLIAQHACGHSCAHAKLVFGRASHHAQVATGGANVRCICVGRTLCHKHFAQVF